MRPALRAFSLLLAAAPACAGNQAAAPRSSPVIAQSDGATDWFGPGATAMRGALRNEIRMDLTRPASVVVLHLVDNGLVQLVGVVRLDSGQHWVEVPAQIIKAGAGEPANLPVAGLDSEIRTTRRLDGECEARQRAAQARRPSNDVVTVAGSCAFMVRVARLAVPPTRSSPDRSRRGSASGRVPDHIMLVASDSAVTAEQVAQRLWAVVEFDFATVTHDLPEYLVGRRTPMWAGYLISR